MSLKSRIEELAAQFADGVLHALREATLEDLLDGRSSSRSESASSSASSPAPRGRPRQTTAAAPAAPKPVAPALSGSVKVAPAKTTKTGRLRRRSPSDLQHVTGLIVAKLHEHKMGLRSEQLQKALKLSKQEITGPIAAALAEKKIVKTGERRATTYFAR